MTKQRPHQGFGGLNVIPLASSHNDSRTIWEMHRAQGLQRRKLERGGKKSVKLGADNRWSLVGVNHNQPATGAALAADHISGDHFSVQKRC